MGNGDGRALVPVVLHPLQYGVSNLGRVYFTTKTDKNIDSSKEGSDCDYAAVSSQENRQQILPRSNRHVCLT